MGKFNEYTQKATPADNDTLMIYDATSKANKLSPFSGIWNWIVGKLTNAVISNLQTNNQTVLGAINELNSKSIFNGIKQPGTHSFPIKQNSCMLVVLQTSSSVDTPVYAVSRYYADICIQLLAGGREDAKASVKNEQLVITLNYSSCVIIYSL